VLEDDDEPLAESYYSRPSLIESVQGLYESKDQEKPSLSSSITSLNEFIGLN
jgi:hypothetical protein